MRWVFRESVRRWRTTRLPHEPNRIKLLIFSFRQSSSLGHFTVHHLSLLTWSGCGKCLFRNGKNYANCLSCAGDAMRIRCWCGKWCALGPPGMFNFISMSRYGNKYNWHFFSFFSFMFRRAFKTFARCVIACRRRSRCSATMSIYCGFSQTLTGQRWTQPVPLSLKMSGNEPSEWHRTQPYLLTNPCVCVLRLFSDLIIMASVWWRHFPICASFTWAFATTPFEKLKI